MGSDPLVEAAREVQRNAYAPDSHFPVGAALESTDGRIFVGCNVENASFGLTMCAERVAVGAAVAAGARSYVRLVVVTDRDPPAPPCGACRQVLAEFGLDLRVDGVGPASHQEWSLGELLPRAFTRDQLT